MSIKNYTMKNRYIFTIFIAFLFFINSSFSQSNKGNNIKNTIYIGYPFTMFDPPDFGIYMSYNPTLKLNKYFAAESQISFAFGSYLRDSGWFRHDGGNLKYGILLTGIRLYLFDQNNKDNLYINALGGGTYFIDKYYSGNKLKTNSKTLLGLSIGIYGVFYDSFVVGVAIESYPSIVFKAGVIF